MDTLKSVIARSVATKQSPLLITCLLSFLIPSLALAANIHIKGQQIRGAGKKPNELICQNFVIPLGGAAIKKIRNTSSAGFFIEGEGGVLLYSNKGENAVGMRLGPGRYRVYPYLQAGHRSDTILLELEPQETGEWITKGGLQNIQKFRPR